MRIYLEVDHSRRRIDSRGDGKITADLVMSHFGDRFDLRIAAYRELLDLRNASTDMNYGDLLRLVDLRRLLTMSAEPGPTAVVASDAALFGTWRALASLTDEMSRIIVFYHIEAAVEWLESEPAEPNRMHA